VIAAETSPALREIRLGPIAAIPPGEGREYRIGHRDVAVFHGRNGVVYATQATCPHRAGPLADGLLGGSILICPLHAWKFDLTTGRLLQGDCGLETYPVHLSEAGDILLSLPAEIDDQA